MSDCLDVSSSKNEIKNREKILFSQKMKNGKKFESFLIEYDESAVLCPDSIDNKLMQVQIRRDEKVLIKR